MTDPHDRDPHDRDRDRDRDENPLGSTVEALLRAPDVWVDPPPDLEHRIVAMVAAESDRSVWRAPIGSTRVLGRMRWPIGLAAAALIAVVVATVTLGGRDPGGGVAVALSGTTLARSASASAMVATTPGGTKIVLDVDELEPAPAGTYYQAWITTGERTVSAGSFHFRGGTSTVELWCGVDDPAGATLVITLQDDDAPGGPSDRVVLTGTIAD